MGVGAGTVHVDTRARRQRVARAPQGLAAAAAVLTLATLGALVAAPVTLGPGGTRAVATAVAALTGAGAAWCAHRIEGRGLLSVAFTTVVRPVLRGAVVIRVVGQVPAHAAVLVSNHPSYLDGPAVMAVDDRIRPVARPQRAPLLRAALSLSGSVVVGRGAVGAGRTHLDRGGLLWLAPEGHRTGAVLERGRTGAARLAAAAGVPIVPVAMRYPEGHGPVGSVGPRLRDWRPWRRPHLVIDIGAPLHPRADETVEHTTRRVMQALAAHTGIPLSPVAASTPMPA